MNHDILSICCVLFLAWYNIVARIGNLRDFDSDFDAIEITKQTIFVESRSQSVLTVSNSH